MASERSTPAVDLQRAPERVTPAKQGPEKYRRARKGLSFRQRFTEGAIEWALFLAGASSIAITLGVLTVLIYESMGFFKHVSIWEFLTGTQWFPQFDPPKFGILPLICGTLVTTGVALTVAIPVGTIIAIYLSEYAPHRLRNVLKPVLELLSAVPTVVYGFFALSFVTPFLQTFIPGLPGFNMLGPGLVMGVMIIPYVSSLSEDAMHAVPMTMREGSYGMGATKMQTAWRVVFPSALSGITAAYILGISRALGETMIVALAAGLEPTLTLDPRQPAATITAYIVQVSGGDLPHGSVGYQSIFAAGLVLMLMTLVFNVWGYRLRKRYREVY